METAYLSLGSNIKPEENIKKAIAELATKVTIKALSTFYQTEPVGMVNADIFYNGVVEIETNLDPYMLKYDVLRYIEKKLGRTRKLNKYISRTIDIDILIFGNLFINELDLVIPDPDIYERSFLSVPLYELAPNLILPGKNIPLAEIVQNESIDNMIKLKEFSDLLQDEITRRNE